MSLKFKQKFKVFSRIVGAIQIRIILSAVYFIIAPLFAFILRISTRKRYSKTGWISWTLSFDSLKDLERQF